MAVNHTLQIDEFAEQPEQLPVHIDYHTYTADQSSRAGCSFRIDTPGSGALLDSEAWIFYTVELRRDTAVDVSLCDIFKITDDAQAADTPGSRQSSASGNKIAFRQGFTMQRAMQSISLNINGTTLVERPDRYADQVLRFYSMPQEVTTMMSGSGGDLDTGYGYAICKADNWLSHRDATTGISVIVEGGPTKSNAAADLSCMKYPDDENWINTGFERRVQKLMRIARTGGDVNAAANPQAESNLLASWGSETGQRLVVVLKERLPISPFMNYEARDLKRSIPHINQMTLNINWNSLTHTNGGTKSMILQGHNVLATANNPADYFTGFQVDWFKTKPVLHLKWIIPPMGYRLPPQISIPIIDYQHFSQPQAVARIADAVNFQESPSISFNNIRLEQIPDLLFIYITQEQSLSTLRTPSEQMFEIVDLDISTDGDSGKMLSATNMELYAMYVRNALGREMIRGDYQMWRKHHCVIVLRPEDMGLRFSPGIRNPVTLNVRARVRNHFNRPRMTGTVSNVPLTEAAYLPNRIQNLSINEDLAPVVEVFWNVLCEYRKYRLTLTESGGSRRELLSLPKADVQSLPQAIPSAAVGGLQGVF